MHGLPGALAILWLLRGVLQEDALALLLVDLQLRICRQPIAPVT